MASTSERISRAVFFQNQLRQRWGPSPPLTTHEEASVSQIVRLIALCLVFGAVTACFPQQIGQPSVAESSLTRQLQERNQEFERDIIQVSPNIYTAVGYGVSTVSMIVGTDGVIIVDTGIDTVTGDQIREDFRAIADLPVKAIIVTHGHGDHTGGIASFVDSPDVEIWARAGFGEEERRLQNAGITVQRQRGAYQAGFLLTPEQRINNGVARAYWPQRGGAVFAPGNKVRPDMFVGDERVSLDMAGLQIDLVPVGGETKDHVYVWVPSERVAFSGDNFYKSWPNLYAIRGTAYRDIQEWANAVDSILNENPVAMVGGHTRPIIGAENVQEILGNYRDAIRFVFDKTVEGINQGMTPNELVEYVQLPEKYDDLDYLQPYYGNPEWAVRSIFSGYLGWFDGNASNLFPLSDQEEAQRIANLAGGTDALQIALEKAIAEEDYQWAAQLSDHVLALNPGNAAALNAKADALTALVDGTLTATARNYYLSSAKMLRARANEE